MDYHNSVSNSLEKDIIGSETYFDFYLENENCKNSINMVEVLEFESIIK